MDGHASPEDVRRIDYFGSLNEAELQAVARVLPVEVVEPRGLIIVEGEAAKGFYLLRKGRARIFRTGPDGREQSLRIVAEGDTFAEVPVFDGGPNPASVEALTRCEAVLVPRSLLFPLMSDHPEIAVTLLDHFARRLRGFTELIEQLSLQTVDARLARYLYQLAREEGMQTESGTIVPRTITQQDLASLLGTVREVVSRTLKTMEEDGVVEVGRHEIVVLDMNRLRERL
jgi:CRP/FNR family transcriptional regulator